MERIASYPMPWTYTAEKKQEYKRLKNIEKNNPPKSVKLLLLGLLALFSWTLPPHIITKPSNILLYNIKRLKIFSCFIGFGLHHY